MLSLPDVRSKQLVIIQIDTNTENSIQLQNDNLLYKRGGKTFCQCSLHRIICLIIIGDLTITTKLIRTINEFGVCVLLLKQNLQPLVLFGAQSEGNYLLRQQQYLLSPHESLEIAKRIVTDKIHNQLILLKSIKQPYEKLEQILSSILNVASREALLGYEGSASHYFFSHYYHDCNWKRRMPRTKIDINNFLLDLGYTLAFNFVDTFLRLFGFDSYAGIYHQLFFSRKSLACDAVEPFRCLIERRLRTAINLKIIKEEDFTKDRYGVHCSWDSSSQYVQLFAEVLIENRAEIYSYIQTMYRHIMDKNNPQPTFQINR